MSRLQDVNAHYAPDVRISSGMVLIVDDTPKNLQLLGETLEGKGYQVVAAMSGAQALAVLEVEHVDVILLDVMMPEMDGFEVCKRLKQNPHTHHIPVIFLTAKTEQDDIIQGLQLGAVDYVTKPFNLTELLVRVRTHLELKLSRDLLAAQSKELQSINAELRHTIETKNRMLSVVSHDLKNPLATMLAASSMLKDDITKRSDGTKKDSFKDDSVELVDIIAGAGKRMQGLVQEILDAAALEMGKMQLHPALFDVQQLLEAVMQEYKPALEKKRQHVHLQVPAEPTVMLADVRRVRQVLDNLLSNAIKYSPPGKAIALAIERTSSTVRFIVRDEGLGFTEQDKKCLFQYFQRGSARPTGGESSHGVGLAIVKNIVELHGGNIVLQSDRDAGHAGATFIVELPLGVPVGTPA